jgi:hypothetical protein
VIDQLTGPPSAVSVMVVPPDEMFSWPPGGSTTSVPAAGERDGLARGGTGVGTGLVVLGVGDAALVGFALGLGDAAG